MDVYQEFIQCLKNSNYNSINYILRHPNKLLVNKENLYELIFISETFDADIAINLFHLLSNDEKKDFLDKYLDRNYSLDFWNQIILTSNIPSLVEKLDSKTDSYNYTLLINLAKPGLETVFQKVLAKVKYPKFINAAKYQIMESLVENNFNGEPYLEILLENGYDPNLVSGFHKLPILHHALIWYNDKAVYYLLKYGADPFLKVYPSRYKHGIQLLHFMSYNNTLSSDVLAKLNLPFEKISRPDEWGRTLLHMAYNNPSFFNSLVQMGFDPDRRALIDDQQKVVSARMKGILPKEYGKTPKELLYANKQ